MPTPLSHNTPPPHKPPRRSPGGLPKLNGESGRLLAMGMELGLLIGGLAYLGYWLDKRYDTAPWLAFSGVVLAMVGGTYNLAKELLKPSKTFSKKTARKTQDETPDSTPDSTPKNKNTPAP